MIAYASIYGNTENAAEILACRLRDRGVKTVLYDVSVTPASNIIAEAFRWSHLVFAAPTYNAGIFVTMDEVLRDLAAHNIQNRTVAFMENGSWAATSGKLMREILSGCKNLTLLEETLSIKSAVSPDQSEQLDALADALSSGLTAETPAIAEAGVVDSSAFRALSYGLFVLTAKDGGQDNGCIINTLQQLTSAPARISITVNKQNYTHDMIMKSGIFNVSVLTQSADFSIFKRFGFQSGRNADKFSGFDGASRSANGLYYIATDTNAFFSARVTEVRDCGTHTLFIADVTEAQRLSSAPSVTYAYYFEHIKPKPQPEAEKKSGYVCKICGYVYEGDTLPEDFVCPLCKHGAEDFEPLR